MSSYLIGSKTKRPGFSLSIGSVVSEVSMLNVILDGTGCLSWGVRFSCSSHCGPIRDRLSSLVGVIVMCRFRIRELDNSCLR